MSAPKDMDLVFKAQQLQQHLLTKGMIKDRKYKLKTYKECFIAKDIIPIIIDLKLIPVSMTNKQENESMAIKFGNDLMQSDIIQHVTKAHMFKNEKLYYKFIPGYNNKPKKQSIADILDIPQQTQSQDNEDQKQEEVVVTNQVQAITNENDDDQTMIVKNVEESPLSNNLLSPNSPSLPPLKQNGGTPNYNDEPSMTYSYNSPSMTSMSNLKKLAELEEKRHDLIVLERIKSDAELQISGEGKLFANLKEKLSSDALTIIVFGASGHLAKTKTYPALYDLFCEGVFPEDVQIVGYARSKLTKKDFDKKISIKLKGNTVEMFLEKCTYFSGKGYDDNESYVKFAEYVNNLEDKKYNGRSNRVAYLATPPTVFVAVCERIKKYLKVEPDKGWMRVIIEKPFGKDLESSNQLAQQISTFLDEKEVYRIDHYLAKEMVQNIIVFRFSNVIWDAIWNRKYVRCVKISMKESTALDGRGGYYDEYGVIRDILQNHLFQVLTLIAMEQPCSLRSEDVRDEKVKVLKCIKPMDEKRTVVGQYSKSSDGKKPGYRDDPSIKNSDNPNSNQITYVQTILFINNHRWAHVPFICKAGKGLDAKNTEVRIQFKNDGLCLFPDANFNEIVMRLQPNEAIWTKVNTKTPGFARFDQAQAFELDITYKNRFGPLKLPAAYTRLILDSLEGDQSLFVRSDELREAWRIVTPFLNKLESENKDPQKYPRGSRGPPQADLMAEEYGFRRSSHHNWKPPMRKGNL